MLDDAQAQAGAPGGARAGLVHAVEALEDALLLLLGDADALVDHGDAHDVGVLRVQRDAHRDPGARLGVADGVVQQVAHGGGDEGGVAAHPQSLGAAGHEGDLAAVGLDAHPVHGLGDDIVDVNDFGLGQGVALLEAGELDDLLDQDAQAAGLLAHAPGVVAHEVGVVGAGLDGLGQQLDRADRGLELVGDVGDEVAAHGLHPAGGGAVLDEDEDAPLTDAGRAHLQVELARTGHPPPGHGDGGVLRLPRGPHPVHHRRHGRFDDGVVAHDVEGVGRRRGAQDLVVVIEDDDGGAQRGQDGDGRVSPGQAGEVSGARGRIAPTPRQRDTDRHPQAHEAHGSGKEEDGDGRTHVSRVVETRRRPMAGFARGRAACGGVAGLLCLGAGILGGGLDRFVEQRRRDASHRRARAIGTRNRSSLMRAIFNQELKQLGSDLESMANQVATAIERAAESLRQGDIVIAEQVIDADERINDLQRDIDDLCVMLLARQQPVAGDLRNVLSALRMAQTLERQGDLARHVAAIARGRYPEPPLPEPVLGLILEMADLAVRAGKDVARLISTRDLDLAAVIQSNDAELDALHRRSFQMILDPAHDLSRQQVIDAVLMGRFLERFGDHSTSVASRVAYLVSGASMPETHDAEDADALH